MGENFEINQKEFAICNSKNMGPIFGAGSDFEIMDESNINENNFSGIGKSFNYFYLLIQIPILNNRFL